MKRFIYILSILAQVMTLCAKNYYVSPQGKAKNNGESKAKAFASLVQAQAIVAPGDTVFIMPGTYKVKQKDLMAPTYQKVYAVAFLLDKSGTPQKPISYIGVTDAQDNRPVFDFSEVKPDARITGFLLRDAIKSSSAKLSKTFESLLLEILLFFLLK